jgi:hypothetical protein
LCAALDFWRKIRYSGENGRNLPEKAAKNTFSSKIIMRKINCWNGKQGFARSAEGRVGGWAVRDTERKQNMTKKLSRLTAAVLALALLVSALAMPASAAISTWATHTTDPYTVADGGTAVLWFIKTTLLNDDMEGATRTVEIGNAVQKGGVAEGSKYTYKGYIWCDDIGTRSYAGLSKTTSSTIYWYDHDGYKAWIDALKSGEISIDWATGYVTAYPGTADAKVIHPDGKGIEGGTGFSLGLGDDGLIIGRGKTALLMAGGAAAFVAAAVIYSDPTILDRAKQKVQDFFVGVADNVTGTVRGWFAPDTPEAEAAASSDAEQPAQELSAGAS